MAPLVQDNVKTYRLQADKLEQYLRKIFPGNSDFKIQLSKDGTNRYIFFVPNYLSRDQKQYIDDKVRDEHPEENPDYL